MASTFDRIAPILMGDLIRDFGFKDFQAAGFVGNFGAESGLISGRQEGTSGATPYPIRGHTGGIDWPQWTGQGEGGRRKAFGDWVEQTGVPYPSYAASYGFVKYELQGAYKKAVTQVKKTTTLKAATETAEALYEKAGIKNMASRLAFAEKALTLYRALSPPIDPLAALKADIAAYKEATDKRLAELEARIAATSAASAGALP